MAKDETKVWLNKDQVLELQESCDRLKDKAIIQLGAWSSLRSNEIAKAKTNDIIPKTVNGKTRRFLKIEGKKTRQKKSEDKATKTREAYILNEVWSNTLKYVRDKDGPLVPNKFRDHFTPTGIQERVRKIARTTAERTNISIYKKVSSHDLRRFFAHYNLVEMGKNPEVIMARGGWENYSSIKPYLDEPSDKNTVETLEENIK